MDNLSDLKILVAEDEKPIRDALVDYLEISFNNIYLASNGEEAFELYKKYKPDILLLDINMPELNGLDLCEKIKDINKNAKIIIISAYTDTNYLLKAIKMHIVAYLVKPIEIEVLEQTIQDAINEIEQKNIIKLVDNYSWDTNINQLFYKDTKVELTNKESLFLELLIKKKNSPVSYETIHYHIYDMEDYSQHALNGLAKRIRQKSTKNIIKSCPNVGYKIETS